MKIHVSPHFILDTDERSVTELEPDGTSKASYNADEKCLSLRIFRDRTDGWFFEPAKKLLEEKGDVAAVHLVTPLIEALEERYQGQPSKWHSSDFFKRRAKQMFKLTDDAAKLLYGGLRCGFSHHGFLKDDHGTYNILLTAALRQPIEYKDDILWVDSQKYVDTIYKAYQEYYGDVESDPGLYEKFLRMWEPDWQMSFRVPGSGGVVPANSGQPAMGGSTI